MIFITNSISRISNRYLLFFLIFLFNLYGINIKAIELDKKDIIDDVIEKLSKESEKKQNVDIKDDIKYENFFIAKKAEIIILNKITAKSKKEIFNLNKKRFFGNLSIEIHQCAKSKDPFYEDNLMLIKVMDNKIDEDNIIIFNGWVTSSNPSLSTVEHSVYEIIPVNCIID